MPWHCFKLGHSQSVLQSNSWTKTGGGVVESASCAAHHRHRIQPRQMTGIITLRAEHFALRVFAATATQRAILPQFTYAKRVYKPTARNRSSSSASIRFKSSASAQADLSILRCCYSDSATLAFTHCARAGRKFCVSQNADGLKGITTTGKHRDSEAVAVGHGRGFARPVRPRIQSAN